MLVRVDLVVSSMHWLDWIDPKLYLLVELQLRVLFLSKQLCQKANLPFLALSVLIVFFALVVL